jgi:hypothetical protein
MDPDEYADSWCSMNPSFDGVLEDVVDQLGD